METEHKPEQPDWSNGSTENHVQSIYHPELNQSSTVPGSVYWFANGSTALMYQQQHQLSLTNASAPPSQDPQLQYSNHEIRSRNGAAQRRFSMIPTPDFVQPSSAYQSFSNTFSENQGSMTTPAIYNQVSNSSAGRGTQFSPQITCGQGEGQYMYNAGLGPPLPHGAQWYSSPTAQQTFIPHYLPSQRD
jgi:hypothetical protein